MSSIAKKLFIKAATKWLFYNAPANYLGILEPLPDAVQVFFTPEADVDGVQLFVINRDELAESLSIIAPLLKPETIFWITYPKKSSGINSDLAMMGNWDEAGKYGLRIVASAAIDDTWTALRFKPEGLSKLSDTRNDEIRKNEYAAFIDVDNKQIILPGDIQEVFTKSANAMAFYQSLSYSNKKEYVIWILSAKQEKTRLERLEKMVKKLIEGKKNPSEK